MRRVRKPALLYHLCSSASFAAVGRAVRTPGRFDALQESLLGGQGRAAGKDRGKRFPAQTALLVISILILLAMLYPVERVRSDNKQLVSGQLASEPAHPSQKGV